MIKMTKTVYIFILIFFLISPVCINAQHIETVNMDSVLNWLNKNSEAIKTTSQDKTVENELRLKLQKLSHFSTNIVPPDKAISESDSLSIRKRALIDSDYNPLFIDWVYDSDSALINYGANQIDSLVQRSRENAMHYVFFTSPELFTFHSSELPSFDAINVGNRMSRKRDLMVDVNGVQFPGDNKLHVVVPKESFWSKNAQFQLQTSENYISNNWYNGGESNLALLTTVTGSLDYNDNKNVQWENNAEYKLGINSSGSDSLRLFRINSDLMKLSSKFGYKAYKNLYYTAEAQVSLPLFNMFVANTYVRSTAFLSPVRSYLSLGLDYKNKQKKSDLSVFLSPFSYKNIFVADTTVYSGVDISNSIARKVGLDYGKNSLTQLGTMLKVTWKYEISDEINLSNKLQWYTNYAGKTRGTEFDWEIEGNFLINRFLSTKVILHPRYDSTVDAEVKPKLQFNQLISFGFNYRI